MKKLQAAWLWVKVHSLTVIFGFLTLLTSLSALFYQLQKRKQEKAAREADELYRKADELTRDQHELVKKATSLDPAIKIVQEQQTKLGEELTDIEKRVDELKTARAIADEFNKLRGQN